MRLNPRKADRHFAWPMTALQAKPLCTANAKHA
jgi:hypothetical protein